MHQQAELMPLSVGQRAAAAEAVDQVLAAWATAAALGLAALIGSAILLVL